uniref:Ig-like domain-containing protein n=1 Tax=Myripristis murdjan TaxID=586833 RepID=A0A667YZ35_9TELE
MTPPRIEHVRTPQTRVTFGQNFQVDCVATGLPDPEVSWSLPDGTLINNALQSDDSDEGDYTCYAKNKLGKDERKLSVKVGPDAPRIRFKSQSLVMARFGESAKLSCQAVGEPTPRIMWISPENYVIQGPSDRYQTLDDGMLVLRGVRKTDEGRYMCLAKNHLGEASLLVELDVASIAEKPSFAVPNIEILPIKQDSGELTLECPARGKPHPEFAWLLPNGTMLTPGAKLQRFTHHLGNGTLRISQPVASDKGVLQHLWLVNTVLPSCCDGFPTTHHQRASLRH